MGGFSSPYLFPEHPDDEYDMDDCQPIQPKQCDHKWVWYAGLSFSTGFYFCELCDEKKDKT